MGERTYLEIFVGSLLPLFRHRPRCISREHADHEHDHDAEYAAGDRCVEDVPILARGSACSRAMGPECYPVCLNVGDILVDPTYILRLVLRQLTSLLLLHCHVVPIALHPVPQLHPELCLFLRRHRFPSLLDAGQQRVGDCMLSPDLEGERKACWIGREEPDLAEGEG